MKNILIWALMGMLAFQLPLQAQRTLRVDEAIAAALENNFGIKVAYLGSQIAENRANPGQAGLFPTISVTGGGNYNNNNTTATLINADQSPGAPATIERTINGNQTSGLNGSLGLSYTVFDGLGNVNNYRLLTTNADLSRIQTAALISVTMAQVYQAYYQVSRQANALKIRQESMSKSQKRLQAVQNQNDFGAANKLAVLNAEVDFNTDSINFTNTALLLDNARRDLNYLIGFETEEDYEVENTIDFMDVPPLSQLEEMALQYNPDLEAAALNQQVAELNLKIAKAARMPRLSVNTSYGYNYANNGPVSFAPKIESNGLAASASLNVPIFTGFRNQTEMKNAEVSILNAQTRKQEQEALIRRDLAKAYNNYLHNLDLIRLNQKSLEAAQANFDRTREAFALAQATSLQFREAQINLLTVENNLNNLQFDVKLQEIELFRLAGVLIPEE